MKIKKFSFVSLLFFLLIIMCLLSLRYGAVRNSWHDVWGLFRPTAEQGPLSQMIMELRVPRTLSALLVGASFAVAGAIMQGITANPIADSGLLGINAGAGLGLALTFALFKSPQPAVTILFAFLGALLSLAIVYFLASQRKFGFNPLKMVLLGAALSSFFAACSQSISLYFNLNQDLVFWLVGGTGNITWSQLPLAALVILCGLFLSFLLGSQITLLSLGDEAAISLGKKPATIRKLAMLAVLLLAGTAVALVGTISFLGLFIPHITRHFVGHDYRKLLPATALLGGLFFVSADLLSRIIAPPLETPVGVIVTAIGVPFLLYQIRRGRL